MGEPIVYRPRASNPPPCSSPEATENAPSSSSAPTKSSFTPSSFNHAAGPACSRGTAESSHETTTLQFSATGREPRYLIHQGRVSGPEIPNQPDSVPNQGDRNEILEGHGPGIDDHRRRRRLWLQRLKVLFCWLHAWVVVSLVLIEHSSRPNSSSLASINSLKFL